jgi:hypothetical protein
VPAAAADAERTVEPHRRPVGHGPQRVGRRGEAIEQAARVGVRRQGPLVHVRDHRDLHGEPVYYFI